MKVIYVLLRMIVWFTSSIWFMSYCYSGELSESASTIGLVEKARHTTVVTRIKAALLDRKDISSRHIRVKYDGKTVAIAGFVKNKKNIKLIEDIAGKQDESADVKTFLAFAKKLDTVAPYKTRIGEQASDAEIWVKVYASLSSPAARGLLENVDVQAVDVRHGNVYVFLILDKPVEKIDITPHVITITGVVKVFTYKVKAYAEGNATSQVDDETAIKD